MKKELSSKTNQIFFLLGIGIFLVFIILILSSDSGLFHLIKLKNQRDDLVQANHELKLENLYYRMEIEKMFELKNISKEARSSLYLVEENEVVYMITDPEKN
jgi:cell division protein FtsB